MTMNHIKTFQLFEHSENADQELLKLAKQLKFPAGFRVTSDSASWRKSGGHAGSKMVSKTMKIAEDELGWTHEFKQSSHPTGSHVSNTHNLYDPKGKYMLVGYSNYGNTAQDNYYYLELSKVKEEKAKG